MSTLKNKKWELDVIDKMIFEDGLGIEAIYFNKKLDLMIVLLNNKRIITKHISTYSLLAKASEKDLLLYKISRTGIHWPKLDEDISLRSFLKSEILNAIQSMAIAA